MALLTNFRTFIALAAVSGVALLSAGGVHAAQTTAQTLANGVNLSGLEFNPGALPGRPGWDYPVPSNSELLYYQSKGLRIVRLPILWERLQPGLIGSQKAPALDPTYLGYITTLLAEANALGMVMMVDVHNYGGYGGHKIGDGTVTIDNFGRMWSLLAQALKGRPGLGGYDLMNEPSNMPSPAVWPLAAQRAVHAIRRFDTQTTIFVEGDDWSSAGSWPQNNGSLNIHDPSRKMIYEAHVYGDRDNSGTHFAWNTEIQYGVTVNTIAERIVPFATWCTAKHAACMIGEIGVGNDDPNWNTELANGLAEMRAAGLLGFTYWAGGPWWGSYPLSIEPRNGQDAAQMAVVSVY